MKCYYGGGFHWIQTKLFECVTRKPVQESDYYQTQTEPRSEKTGLRGFQPGPTQTGLYSHRRWLEV